MQTFNQFFVENEIKNELSSLKAAGYKLLAHQTNENIAKKIIQENFGSSAGIGGTALFTSPEAVEDARQEMFNKKSDDTYRTGSMGLVHGGSDAIVIMAIPPIIAGFNIRNTDALDNQLFDLYNDGLLKEAKVPNKNIFGYIKWDGSIVKNPNFDLQGSPLK